LPTDLDDAVDLLAEGGGCRPCLQETARWCCHACAPVLIVLVLVTATLFGSN
jgi:hypothetical protein